MDHRPFSEALALEIGEQYAVVATADLPTRRDASVASDSVDRASKSVEQDGDLPNGGENEADGRELSEIEALVARAGLEELSIEELRLGHYLFYAVIGREIGTSARIGFIRQVDPHRVERQGFLKTIAGQHGLQKLEEPIFVFEDGFDVVVAPSEIAILRLEPFNRIFADLAPIIAAAESNAEALAAVLPKMVPSATSALARVAASRPSLARRLQRLARPGAMPTVTPTQLTTAMKKHGLDPNLLVKRSRIDFADDGVVVFLDMMDELYYETDFTHQHRRADRFSSIQ
jgi:hypothetical protein